MHVYVWVHVCVDACSGRRNISLWGFCGSYLGGRLYPKAFSYYSQEISLAAREFVIRKHEQRRCTTKLTLTVRRLQVFISAWVKTSATFNV